MKNLELTFIDKSKKSILFLEKRLKVDNYRGIQISQHNRYNLNDIFVILEILYKYSKKEKMEIRTTDISKRPYNLPNEEKFAEYVNEVNLKMGRCTQDSIRKNIFVDLNRMGLINRYHKDELVLPHIKKKITSISISDLGIELLECNNVLEKQMKYSECIDNLLKGVAVKLMKILSELEKITLLEFTFFISFIDQKLENKIYLENDIIDLIKDFRTLAVAQKNFIEKKIKEYAQPKNFKGNKKNKKDYNNWNNESQQILNLLNQTALYEYDMKTKTLIFKCDKTESLFKKDEIKKLKRSIKAKEKYFEEHEVSKKKGYELHHVVPLLKAKNSEHFFLLDVWENLLYIDAKTHSIITQNGNRQIVLKILENYDIELTDLENPIHIKFDDNVFYGIKNAKKIENKNIELLKIL